VPSTLRHSSNPLLVLSVRLPEALIQQLARLAQAEDRSVSSVVRSLLIGTLVEVDL
jgi:predicted transcriptional regulator